MTRFLLPTVLAAALAVAGCSTSPASTAPATGGMIVATTAVAGDIARSVAGSDAEIRVLVPPGGDAHDFEPRPSDAKAIARATMIVRSGGEIDEWAGDLITAAGTDAPVVDLLASAERIGEDPHWWHDPANAARAARALGAAMDAEEAGASAAAGYEQLGRDLDACLEPVPDPRVIVTSHDALAYFAARYGFEVAPIVDALTTQAQPSARDASRLVTMLREDGIRAVFPEASLDPALAERIAREGGAEVGDDLFADGLGPEGGPAATLEGALRHNADAVSRGLGGPGCR